MLNFPHTEFSYWLKGILTTFPEADVKDQFVIDLMELGYAGTREELERKMAFEKKQVITKAKADRLAQKERKEKDESDTQGVGNRGKKSTQGENR